MNRLTLMILQLTPMILNNYRCSSMNSTFWSGAEKSKNGASIGSGAKAAGIIDHHVMVAPLTSLMMNGRPNMPSTNTSTDETEQPKPKPKKKKVTPTNQTNQRYKPVTPTEALEMLRSAIVYCQISGVPLKFNQNQAGLRLQLDNVFLDGVRFVHRPLTLANPTVTPVSPPQKGN